MSDNIPFEIQTEILKRLPTKPLIRSRSVSKPWKSLIDSSEFIATFNLKSIEPRHLLVSYYNNNEKYVSFLDDNTFPQHKSHLTFIISADHVNQVTKPTIIGSSLGLFCFYSYDINIKDFTRTAVIWNPSIRKSVSISVPNVLPSPYKTVVGFGVCPRTSDPKLVKFMFKERRRFLHPHCEFVPKIIPPRVEICALKSRVWRTISANLPRESIALKTEHVAIDGFIYWLGYDRKYVGNNTTYCSNLILLFDITKEEFMEEVKLPGGLDGSCDFMRVSKLRDSVVVLQTDIRADDQEYDVWMMENGVAKSFRKLYTIKSSDASIKRVLGFRKTGEPIISMRRYSDKHDGIFVYDPDTEQFSYIGISGNRLLCFASSYVESLILFDHRD